MEISLNTPAPTSWFEFSTNAHFPTQEGATSFLFPTGSHLLLKSSWIACVGIRAIGWSFCDYIVGLKKGLVNE
jgi:hypothetical protein